MKSWLFDEDTTYAGSIAFIAFKLPIIIFLCLISKIFFKEHKK